MQFKKEDEEDQTLIISEFAPKILGKPYQVWMQIGNLLGSINNCIIFGIVFVAVLQAIAFLIKVFGYDQPTSCKKVKIIEFLKNKKN